MSEAWSWSDPQQGATFIGPFLNCRLSISYLVNDKFYFFDKFWNKFANLSLQSRFPRIYFIVLRCAQVIIISIPFWTVIPGNLSGLSDMLFDGGRSEKRPELINVTLWTDLGDLDSLRGGGGERKSQRIDLLLLIFSLHSKIQWRSNWEWDKAFASLSLPSSWSHSQWIVSQIYILFLLHCHPRGHFFAPLKINGRSLSRRRTIASIIRLTNDDAQLNTVAQIFLSLEELE